MQITAIAAAAFALVAGASAQAAYNSTPSYPIAGNGTLPAGAAAPSGTGSGSSPSSSASFVPDSSNSASTLSTGAMGLIVVGSIALAL